MPAPKSGELKSRVRFERRPKQQDGFGNTEGPWRTLIERKKARLRPTKGGEQVIAGRAQGTAAWDLWVRRDSQSLQVTTDDRVVNALHPTQTFAIRFIGDLEDDRRWLLMQLEEGVAE